MATSTKSFEPFLWRAFQFPHNNIIGVDEVGRGCLAGPVYAAAVILNPDLDCSSYTDSKIVNKKNREKYSLEIESNHLSAIGMASVEEIEKLNILWASLLAMKRAVLALDVKEAHILVDGNKLIPQLPECFTQEYLIKGDLRAEPIGAASIVAKVKRDQFMQELSSQYPGYGFEGHKGYATKTHKQAIQKKGATPWHRKSFSGVKEFL